MIQRIQTLYLLLAAILMSLTVLLPLAAITGDGQQVQLMAFGLRSADADGTVHYGASANYMGILLCLCAVLPLVTVFFFKRRMVQIRLCYAGLVIMAGAQVMVGYYLWMTREAVEGFGDGSVVFSLPDVFPLVSLMFMWLALRGIVRDEALVRSMDRIR